MRNKVPVTDQVRQIYDQTELELTFCVNYIPTEFLYGDAGLPTKLDDVYLTDGNDHIAPRVKYRKAIKGGRGTYLMVIKDLIDGNVDKFRKMNIGMSPSECQLVRESLLRTKSGVQIVKDRYKLDICDVQGCKAQLYVYQGPLWGLVTISFKNLTEAQYEYLLNGPRPDFIGPQAFSLNGCCLALNKPRGKRGVKQLLAQYDCRPLDPGKVGLRCYQIG